MQRFADEARSAGADVQVVIAPGAHNRAYWRSQATAYLHFYADRWAGAGPAVHLRRDAPSRLTARLRCRGCGPSAP